MPELFQQAGCMASGKASCQAYLRVLTVTVQWAVPVLASQYAVVGAWSTTQRVVLAHRRFNIPGYSVQTSQVDQKVNHKTQ